MNQNYVYKGDDGNCAFPATVEHGCNPGGWPGMSLRDYFAAKAMQGDWASGSKVTEVLLTSYSEDRLLAAAHEYYRMADAMLAARNKPRPAVEPANT